MSEDIEQTVITRVKYYKGQPLTAQDFIDEQKYHNDKLKLLLKRFPTGIIKGLEVSDEGSEGIYKISIASGIGVNAKGDLLAIYENQKIWVGNTEAIVENNQITISQNDAIWPGADKTQNIYINISPEINETVKNNSLCDSSTRKNRIEETVKITFDNLPGSFDPEEDLGKCITIAVLKYGSGKYTLCENNLVVVDARIMKENQIQYNDNGHDHSGGINGKKLSSSSLDPSLRFGEDKINFNDNGHDHSGGVKGKLLSSSSLDPNLRFGENKIDFNNGGHNHSGGVNGTQIDFTNLLNVAVASNDISVPNDGDPNNADEPGGDGIRTSHIRNGAVTTAKIADNAIESVKIHVAEYDTSGNVNPQYGIKASHIQKGAITATKIADNAIESVKIHDAEYDTSGNVNPQYGIKASHIQKGAITAAKIADNAIESVKIHDAEYDTNGNVNPQYGIKASHIQKGAITTTKIADGAIESAKIANWSETEPQKGITTSHLQNGAVTESKLSIIEKKDYSFTIPGTQTHEYEVTVGKNCMIQIFPQNSGSISWNILSLNKVDVKDQEIEKIKYVIEVRNISKLVVSIQFRLIKFGICPEPPISVIMINMENRG
jgi:hypothetical protein